jgi:peptidoglycan/xylan/chitin deacetylase (PgdA/CDA1 family)
MPTLFALPARADTTNLVSNGDFETANTTDPLQPAGWFQDNWGTNTPTFSYLNEGHGGTHAVRTTLTNYQDGDAKWIFNAVPVTAGTSYDYTDWYRANAVTNVWVRYEMQDGTVQFQWLKSDVAATDWAQTTAAIAVPANVQRMSVFHVLNANGQLDMDDVSLTQEVPCTPTLQNGLPNGGFEQSCPANPNMPAGWQTQTYGPDPVSFTYSADAHSGTHAANITTTSANDEASWITTIQSPVANQRYQLSFWQKGTVYSYAYLTETMTDNSTKDVSLMSVPATNNVWSQYKDEFIAPSAIQSIKLVLATSGQGTVTFDDVSLQNLTNQVPPSFASPMVSVTLDDGLASEYTNGEATLNADGMTGTFYVNGDTLGKSGYMTNAQLKKTAADGNEIGSHLYHHSDMVQLDTPTIISELTGNKTDLQNILGSGFAINSFASPYGSYTSGDIDTVMQYQQSHRNTDGELNTKANLDPRQIHGRLVTPDTTQAEFNSWLADAQAQHAWLVLVYHGITTAQQDPQSGEAGYTITPTAFTNQMTALKNSGITVLPVGTALTALQGQ